MKLLDLLRMGLGSLIAHRLRSSLSALGIAVGIAAVILLTSFGEGINRFVIAEFSRSRERTLGSAQLATTWVQPLSEH